MVDTKSPPILGVSACEELGLIQRSLHSVETGVSAESLYADYKDVCGGLSPVSTKPAVPGVPGAGAGNAGNRREWKSGMVLGRPGAGLGVSTGPAGGTHTFLLEKLNQI